MHRTYRVYRTHYMERAYHCSGLRCRRGSPGGPGRGRCPPGDDHKPGAAGWNVPGASSRPAVSELAARWHFTDGSHFTRTFKQRYGETPTQYARRTRAGRAE
ncbi:AraC family transcriptional regulator [Nonomuraea terrae]|uniref:AraC family transcriptional regulator n=1 Tax=Nonomuraea terrae TaxID=2530383 RepID=A0A4R4YM34_9ACTN|nr:AraC family transcriptional regulator [Nonomuraea terrae]